MSTPQNKNQQKQKPLEEPEVQRRAKSDPSRAPEEEGSATQTPTKGRLLDRHKTDESGAPVD